MKSMKRLFSVTILSVFVFQIGCLRTRSQLRETGSQESAAVQVQTPEQKLAAKEMQVDEVNQSISELVGRVELLEKNAEIQRAEKVTETTPEEKFNERFKLYEQAITKLEIEIQGLKKEIEDLKSSKAAEVSKKSKSAYELAEEHFKKKEWKKAIFQYKKYVDKNPKGKSIADSTYKIGVCFQELGLNDEAKYFYNEVVERFKSSKTASMAKYRLKNIK